MHNFSINAWETIEKTQQRFLGSLVPKHNIVHRLKRFQTHGLPDRFDQAKIGRAYGIDEPKRFSSLVDSLLSCGGYLEFRWYRKSDVTKLHTANFCKKDRLCPACAVRRAYKQQGKFLKIMESDPELLEQDWFYVVIPVKHVSTDSFSDVYSKVVGVLRRISQSMRNGRLGRSGNIWTNFAGAMYSIETTKSKNGWNVHINLLINAPKGFDLPLRAVLNKRGQVSYQNQDIRDWLLSVTGDSQMHHVQKLDFSKPDQVKDALIEVLKYSLKFSSLDTDDLIEFYSETYRKRLFGTFGNLRGHDLEGVELEGDEPIDEDFLRIIFWRSGFHYDEPIVESVVSPKKETFSKPPCFGSTPSNSLQPADPVYTPTGHNPGTGKGDPPLIPPASSDPLGARA